MTREEAIKILKGGNNRECNWSEYCEAYEMAIQALKQEPKTGHWLTHKEYCDKNNLLPSGLGSYYWCSECCCGIDSSAFHQGSYNYCPDCGADMRSDSSKDDYNNGNVNFRLFLEYCKILLTDSNISNKEAVEELLMLKRTVKANSDADKALDKAIEQLRLIDKHMESEDKE